jgi:hypothetical protein
VATETGRIKMKRFALGFFGAIIAFAAVASLSMILRSGGINKPGNVYRIGFPFVFVAPSENSATVHYFSRDKLAADLAIGFGASLAAGFCLTLLRKRRHDAPREAEGTTVIDFWTKS